MEEKKEVKISLSTGLLLIAIVIIVIMGVVIYALYDKNAKMNNQELQVGNLEKIENSVQNRNSKNENNNTVNETKNEQKDSNIEENTQKSDDNDKKNTENKNENSENISDKTNVDEEKIILEDIKQRKFLTKNNIDVDSKIRYVAINNNGKPIYIIHAEHDTDENGNRSIYFFVAYKNGQVVYDKALEHKYEFDLFYEEKTMMIKAELEYKESIRTIYGKIIDGIFIKLDEFIQPLSSKEEQIYYVNEKEVSEKEFEKAKDQYNNKKFISFSEKAQELKKEVSTKKEKNYTDIILDGSYAFDNSDSGWHFTKDGKVSSSGNVSVSEGTYKTTGKNSIEAHYTVCNGWNEELNKEEITTVDWYEYFEIDDNNNLYIIYEDGQKAKLSKDNSKTVSQMPGVFYEIKDLTKESRSNEDIKNYKDFEFDLDGDGIIDKITLKHIVNKNEPEYSSERSYYILSYNGKTIYEHWEGRGTVGIVDLDATDKYLEIWVYDGGPSDDPYYHFYRKVGNEIIKMGNFSVDIAFLCDGNGTVLSADREAPFVNPTVFENYYTIENNKFKENNLDFSYNKDVEYTSNRGLFTKDLNNLKKFINATTGVSISNIENEIEKYDIHKLDKNTTFKIKEFVKKESEDAVRDLKIVLSDGTEGYLIHPYGRIDFYD